MHSGLLIIADRITGNSEAKIGSKSMSDCPTFLIGQKLYKKQNDFWNGVAY